jgi:gamma-D-glutamyl-L-lysine dipeptidyl-peptidase
MIATINAPLLNLPDSLGEQVSEARAGALLELVERRGEWTRVRTPHDGYPGWIRTDALSPPPERWNAPWAEVNELWINLRRRPDSCLPAETRATIGVRLPLLALEEHWVELLLPDGRRLWTERPRVLPVPDTGDSPRSRSVGSILRTARRFLGVPYLWGGCTPFGLDCSGFVQLVLGLHGIPLRRDAGQQAEQGVSPESVGGGDLVFFAPPENPGAIDHVGLLLDGDRFIHAAGSDRVRINRLGDAAYRRTYWGARRVR